MRRETISLWTGILISSPIFWLVYSYYDDVDPINGGWGILIGGYLYLLGMMAVDTLNWSPLARFGQRIALYGKTHDRQLERAVNIAGPVLFPIIIFVVDFYCLHRMGFVSWILGFAYGYLYLIAIFLVALVLWLILHEIVWAGALTILIVVLLAVGANTLYTLAVWTYPVNLYFSAALFLTFIVRKTSNPFGKAVDTVFRPITLASLAVLSMQLIFNLFDSSVRWIRIAESWMASSFRRSEEFDGWLSLSLLQFLGLITVLLLLTKVFPKIKVVHLFFGLKEKAEFAIAILACFGGFTFFSGVPYSGDDRLAVIEAGQRDEKSQQEFLRLRLSVAKALVHTAHDHQSYYLALSRALNSEVPYHQQQSVLKRLVDDQIGRMPQSAPPIEKDDEDSSEGNENPTWKVLQEAFCHAIGAVTPDSKGIASKVFAETIDELAKSMFNRHIKPEMTKEIHGWVKSFSASSLASPGKAPGVREVRDQIRDEVLATKSKEEHDEAVEIHKRKIKFSEEHTRPVEF